MKVSRLLTVGDPMLAGYCAEKHYLSAAGVFSSGIYCEDDKGKILMLYDRVHGSLPFGLAGTEINGNAKDLGIAVGSALCLEQNCLMLADGSMFARIEYRPYLSKRPILSAAEGINFLQIHGGTFLSTQNKSNLSPFSLRDSTQIKRDDFDDVFAVTGLAGIQRIEQGMRTANKAELSAGLDGVLGLGRGLTPSFDDFITGMISALHYYNREWGLEFTARGELCSLVTEKAEKKTNRYSAAYLLGAAAGGRFSAIEDFLAEAGGDNWLLAANRLSSIGGSSGADMMAGVVFAARIINDVITEERSKIPT